MFKVAPTNVDPSEKSSQCELHVWPAKRFRALDTGPDFGLIGALVGVEHGTGSASSLIEDALDSAAQLNALRSLQLIALLKTPPAVIIWHADPLNFDRIDKMEGRNAHSIAPCYAELIVVDVGYLKSGNLHTLKTFFMLRDFGIAESTGSLRTYKNSGAYGLAYFPPRKGENPTAAAHELVEAFQSNFTEFASKEVKDARKHATNR